MLGYGFYEFLIIAALILIVVDFFFASDILSHAAYVLLSFVVVILADLPWLYGVLLGLVVWFVAVFFHYAFFRKIIEKFCNRFISPSVIEDEPLARYVGESTAVVSVGGKRMLRLEGDLVAFKNSEKFDDGDIVEVISFKEGVIEVAKK
ncbi:hypothetical protein N9B14_00230 [Akkermansiaceae bacterium]|nr:hypothetical protein [Akkermansiaceae bacterium]